MQAVAFNGAGVTFKLVETLDETTRGEGGFGSTDAKVEGEKKRKLEGVGAWNCFLNFL